MGEVTCGDCDKHATLITKDLDGVEHAFCQLCWDWMLRWLTEDGFNETNPSGRYDDE